MKKQDHDFELAQQDRDTKRIEMENKYKNDEIKLKLEAQDKEDKRRNELEKIKSNYGEESTKSTASSLNMVSNQ